jgi:hypothetical protein
MLRAALALLSTLQVGAHIKELCKRYLRQAIVIAVAAGLLIAAAVFETNNGITGVCRA